MKNVFQSRNLYKLIVCVFLVMSIIKIRGQLVTLNVYNKEISTLNEKIVVLEEKQSNTDNLYSDNSRKDNEDIARKDLKMYYPNETPYKGY